MIDPFDNQLLAALSRTTFERWLPRREGVKAAALNLQAAGLISYTRGHITVLDRQGLERRYCECYGVVKKEHERLLPGREPAHAVRECAFA